MYTDVVTFLVITETVNGIGDTVESITRREVFARKQSVYMSETYKALAIGLEAKLTFVLADPYDYESEEYLEHEGTRYRIFRTFQNQKTGELEIVVMG